LPTQVQCADGRWVNTGVPPRVKREFEALWGWLEELGLIPEFPEAVFIEMGMQRERLDLSGLTDDDEVQAIYGAGREAMNLIASRLSAYEFFLGAHRRGMPVGVINSPDELFEDPHFIARGVPTRVEHEDLAKSFVYPGGPYRFSRTPWRIQGRPPHLGEHNAIVLGKTRSSD
jgi:crotonobetainyl-CoA:carnitine CoA-transferase CaiB-like acyl-CoA transferase